WAVLLPQADPPTREEHDRAPGPAQVQADHLLWWHGHVRQRRVDRDQDKWVVEEERLPPRDRVDEQSADERAEQRRARRRPCPQPERAPLFLALEAGRDDGEGPRHQEGPRRPLEDPERDEELDAGGDAAEDGRDAEPRQ